METNSRTMVGRGHASHRHLCCSCFGARSPSAIAAERGTGEGFPWHVPSGKRRRKAGKKNGLRGDPAGRS